MSRPRTQKRSKSAKRYAKRRRFNMESMEARRLMAGDLAVAGDVVEIESMAPIAIIAESDKPMPQTREHILLARQVSIPSNANADDGGGGIFNNGGTVGIDGTNVDEPTDETVGPGLISLVLPAVSSASSADHCETTADTMDDVKTPGTVGDSSASSGSRGLCGDWDSESPG